MQKPQWNRIKDFVQRKELSLAMGLHLGAIFLCGLIYGSSGIWSDKSIKYEKKPL